MPRRPIKTGASTPCGEIGDLLDTAVRKLGTLDLACGLGQQRLVRSCRALFAVRVSLVVVATLQSPAFAAEPSTAAPPEAEPSTAAPPEAEPSTAAPPEAEPSTPAPPAAEPGARAPRAPVDGPATTPARTQLDAEQEALPKPGTAVAVAREASVAALATYKPVLSERPWLRRDGFLIGLGAAAVVGGASGYPNDNLKIDRPEFYTEHWRGRRRHGGVVVRLRHGRLDHVRSDRQRRSAQHG